MKILFLTNLYPPHFIGGYEQLCMDAVDGLMARGHECYVLTSTYGVGRQVKEGHVYRLLQLEGDFGGSRHGLVRSHSIRTLNEKILKEKIDETAPDAVFVWSMRRFSRSLILLTEQLHPKVIYYVTDNWLLDQHRPTSANLKKYLVSYKNLLHRPKLSNVICSSQHMKKEMIDCGIPLDAAKVVYNGVDLAPYLSVAHSEPHGKIRILYVGRLVEEKGVHTLVDAFVSIGRNKPDANIALTVVGAGDARYTETLKESVRAGGADAAVAFVGNVAREDLAGYFAEHDIFVFPSIWQEPFSLTLVMALASHVAVIGTLCGGSKEILKDTYNCLTFKPGDVADLASKIETLAGDAALRQRLADQGRKDSLNLDLPRMIDKVEIILREMVSK